MTPEEYARRRRVLVDSLIAALVRLFLGLDSWRITQGPIFTRQAIPLVIGAQRAMAALTTTYLTERISETVGAPVGPPPVPDREVINLRGVDNREVYERPFKEIYTALSRGLEFPVALDRGVVRLEEIAELDLQQTHARVSRAALTAPTVQRRPTRPSGWRRTLQGPRHCALCIVASTRIYRVENLKAIHKNCDCGIEPVFGEIDDDVIDEELLEQVHDAVEELTGRSDRGGRRVDYSKVIIEMTNEHGELGPMLARPNDRFTSAEDLPQRTWRARR